MPSPPRRRSTPARALRARALAVSCALSLSSSAAAAAQDRIETIGGRRVAVWEPRGAVPATGRAPMLVFSHGFGGCATRSNYLNNAFARRGYWVFAPHHRDGSCAGKLPGPPEIPFRDADRWSDATFADRRDDIRAVERALRADRVYGPRLDFLRMGYVGHSLGGYTIVGLAGGWPSWEGAPRPRAVLALSPYVEPFLVRNTLGALNVPVMLQGGTADGGITPALTRRGGAYDDLRAPKYLVVFRGARHGAWGDRGSRVNHAAIVESSLAFLDRYVRGTSPAPALTTSGPRVASMRFESELGSTARGSASTAPHQARGSRMVKQLP